MVELCVDNPYQISFIFVADGAARVLEIGLKGVLHGAILPKVVGKAGLDLELLGHGIFG